MRYGSSVEQWKQEERERERQRRSAGGPTSARRPAGGDRAPPARAASGYNPLQPGSSSVQNYRAALRAAAIVCRNGGGGGANDALAENPAIRERQGPTALNPRTAGARRRSSMSSGSGDRASDAVRQCAGGTTYRPQAGKGGNGGGRPA
ncbi:hypothetical protein JKP88DRAFT_350132 [Tribonema minus]|uniref:Uncharacterized protein n=1 Tax=Tribonema minus TaxID=303371 RepID=A0A835YNV5_9STRA|nr:hypothetical protein JKP88DRAFT_350132 [Tribonema minus]